MGVLFVADLSEDTSTQIIFTPSNDVSRQYNVYESYLGTYPDTSYWIDWGGWYDNPIINQIELYISTVGYLQRVYTLQEVCDTPNSIYDEPTAGTVYINVGKHTWLYNDVTTEYRKTVSYISGPKNPSNPSDDVFNNEHWKVRLEIPKFTVKLSDAINGLTKYSTFDFTLYNEDGYFDDLEATNFFNAPSYIRKTWKENPVVEDFIPIRYGMVETIKINDKTIQVSCADLFRTLEEPVSKVVKDVYISAIENKDENLPVVYGQVVIPLIETVKRTDSNAGQYVAGENITGVLEVYNKEGNPVSFSVSADFSIISSGENVKSALVIGNTDNKIGQVITNVISNKTRIQYSSSFWDITETDEYIQNSPEINIAFTGGTVREAVKQALISDMVFLIQKNNSRFTLRQWGQTYTTVNLKNWEITQFPVKSYDEAQKNYLSSCSIQYNYNFSDKVYNDVLLYNANETSAETVYNKLVRKEFKTYLTNQTDAFTLGKKVSDRFSILRETVQVGVGHDTSAINLLDTVELELTINSRKFSKNTTWIVKELDPAQDILTLEPITAS
jgi:hypothetical protein